MPALPDMSLLQSFVTVAQELNFRRSAERLALDQSALSRRIQKPESQLGYALLERTTREVLLTQAGQTFYAAPCACSMTMPARSATRAASPKAAPAICGSATWPSPRPN